MYTGPLKAVEGLSLSQGDGENSVVENGHQVVSFGFLQLFLPSLVLQGGGRKSFDWVGIALISNLPGKFSLFPHPVKLRSMVVSVDPSTLSHCLHKTEILIKYYLSPKTTALSPVFSVYGPPA
jgi:hypothetical protein